MKTIKLIGFERANGTHWNHKPDDYHYEPIALVKNNGMIVWYMDKQEIPPNTMLKILFSAREKEKQFHALKDGAKKAKERLQNAVKGSLEYFNALHSYYWHLDAINSAEC